MNWVLASILMFVSSVVLYLSIRRSTLLKVPTQLNNLAMFILPITAYAFVAYVSKAEMKITSFQFLLILLTAIFFSYLGNVLSLISLELAPNPGYSLMISKSYVVFTTIAAIFVFHSELTLKSAFAIAIIVASSILISLNNKAPTEKKENIRWLELSFGAFFCWGMLALMSKYLLDIGVGVLPRLIYSMIIVSALIAIEMKFKKVKYSGLTASQLITLLVIGISASGFNYFMQLGYQLAPNPGYINAVNASSISLVTLFSIFLFKDEFSLRRFVGIIGATLGLLLLLLK